MKRTLLLLSCLGLFIASCKKDNSTTGTTATPAQLADVDTKLSGTWAVAGLPKQTLYPYSGSVSFSTQSTVTYNDYANTQTQAPYVLTGTDGVYYINVKSGDTLRKTKVVLLTADSLKLQSTITTPNVSGQTTFNEVFVKANINEINNRVFKITISQFNGGTAVYYPLNVNAKIYITHKGGAEQLAADVNAITQTYVYSYTPTVGDHIRIAVTDPTYPTNPAVFTCLANFKGVPYGRDWQSDLFSSLPGKAWDINN